MQIGRIYRNGTLIFYSPNIGKIPKLLAKQKEVRKFTINRSKLQSACIKLWGLREKKTLLFLTFTFPIKPTEDEASKIWKIMLDNLRNQYKIKDYVWIKEPQTKNDNRLHYHILINADFISVKDLQGSWDNHIRHICPNAITSHNSVRLGKRPRVYTVKSVKNYLSKYICKDVKGNSVVFNRRAWGTTIKNTDLYKEFFADENILSMFQRFFYEKISINDVKNNVKDVLIERFYEIYHIHNYIDFTENSEIFMKIHVKN